MSQQSDTLNLPDISQVNHCCALDFSLKLRHCLGFMSQTRFLCEESL